MAKVTVAALETSAQGGNFVPAAPGIYSAIIVASVDAVDTFDSVSKDVTNLLFQFTEEIDGGKPKVHYVKSAGLTPSLHEKAGFFKFLTGWLKIKDPKALLTALTAAKIIENGELDFEKFVGRRMDIMIGNKTSGKGKEYAKIMDYMPLKNKALALIPGKIPDFYIEGAKGYKIIDGVKCDAVTDGVGAADTAADLNMEDLVSTLMD